VTCSLIIGQKRQLQIFPVWAIRIRLGLKEKKRNIPVSGKDNFGV
jgi:hypothetical protein